MGLGSSWLGAVLGSHSEELASDAFVASLQVPIANLPWAPSERRMLLDLADFRGGMLVLESSLAVQLTENVRTGRTQIRVHMMELPPSIELRFSLFVDFDDNPTLEFNVAGEFSMSGNFLLTGSMIGMWEDAFGFEG